MSQTQSKEHSNDGQGPVVKRFVLWLASVIIVGFVASYATSVFTYKDSVNLQNREQALKGIEQFQQSGSSLDNAFQVFNDALVDKHDVDDARRSLRTAIARHSSDANAFENVLGLTPTKSYIAELARFRVLVDETTDPMNSMPMAQAGLDLISDRKHLLADAEAAVKTKGISAWIPFR